MCQQDSAKRSLNISCCLEYSYGINLSDFQGRSTKLWCCAPFSDSVARAEKQTLFVSVYRFITQ